MSVTVYEPYGHRVICASAVAVMYILQSARCWQYKVDKRTCLESLSLTTLSIVQYINHNRSKVAFRRPYALPSSDRKAPAQLGPLDRGHVDVAATTVSSNVTVYFRLITKK
jgi:hypothetical protein